MAIEWDDRVVTGNELIDAQHRELFARVNKLLEAYSSGRGKQVVLQTLAYLQEYTTEHFAAEEDAMRACSYPEMEAHRQAHAEFISGIAELRQETNRQGAGDYLTIMTNRLLVDWLLNHVKNTDRALADYLRQHPVPSEPPGR